MAAAAEDMDSTLEGGVRLVAPPALLEAGASICTRNRALVVEGLQPRPELNFGTRELGLMLLRARGLPVCKLNRQSILLLAL